MNMYLSCFVKDVDNSEHMQCFVFEVIVLFSMRMGSMFLSVPFMFHWSHSLSYFMCTRNS